MAFIRCQYTNDYLLTSKFPEVRFHRTRIFNFEDCLQDRCAEEVSANYIITRNTADFEASVVSAIEPDEWLKKLKEKSLGTFLRDFINVRRLMSAITIILFFIILIL